MPVINKPLLYANTATWNGSGTATVTVDFGFQPDLVWIKPRNNVASNANSHILIDSVRGSDKVLRSQTTGAEVTESNNITAFTSTGITIGNSHNVNKNTTSQYVAWAWKKGATQGFDIVSFDSTVAAQTISHSLGVAPSMIILKNRAVADGWYVYHKSLGATQGVYLHLTNAAASVSWWNSTAPTSSVFSVNMGNAYAQIAYLFAEVAGFSKFGSYTGNGSTDGPFVYCGFLPRFIIIKRTDTTSTWLMVDTVRQTYNVLGPYLTAESSGAETTGTVIFDVLSNGFKMRSATSANASGGTYIFAAFSEFPFKNSLAR